MVGKLMKDKMNRIYQEAQRLVIDEKSKIVIMSDCHRGNGEWSDNFADNEKIYFTALREYYNNGFTYIELGDGDELWENKDYRNIIQLYSHIYWLLSQFYREGRFYMIYGNHDRQKQSSRYTEKNLSEYYNEATDSYVPLFPKIQVHEGLVLKIVCCDTQKTILLVHGHQGDLLNDYLWRLAKWLVRYVWKPMEVLGFNNPMMKPNNYTKKAKFPHKVEEWADSVKQLTIAGHTHMPLCPSDMDAYYFNTGSCVHPRCITAIEIEGRALKLVKWCVDVDADKHLVVKKEMLAQHYFI